jgi:hypothetical protein
MMRKLFCYIVLLLWSFNVLAQSAGTIRKDTLKRFMLIDAPSMHHQKKNEVKKLDTSLSKLPDSTVYVIDGEVSRKKLVGIDPKDIFSVDIIKQDVASEHFEGEARNGLVVVVTKNGAIKSYQKKLSAFSVNYKKYIVSQTKYNDNDNGIMYKIIKNGNLVFFDEKDKIRELYNIPAAKISKVEFHQQQTCCGINTSVYISIEQ